MTPTAKLEVGGKEHGSVILFDESKAELFKLSDGYRSLHKKLKTQWKVVSNREDLSKESVAQAAVLVLACPRQRFTEGQFSILRRHVDEGGSLFVLAEEGGEKKANSNINFLLEEYGIAVNNDSVVRTCYYRYFHPKECLINNGVLNRAILDASGKNIPSLILDESRSSRSMAFVYPFGCTLNVARPAVAVLSTGSISFPLNRPVCAFYEHPRNRGRVAVLGSAHMLCDQYLDREENSKIKDVVFQFLTAKDFKLNQIDADDPEISDYNMTPDVACLAENLRTCLQESEEVPTDYTQLFHTQLTSVDMQLVPASLESYSKLNVKHEPLRLITPQFETPLPPLQPAVFPPSFRELPHPSLELFDLDEAFSSEKSRLAQVTNKCKDEDLEYYVRECGDILSVMPKLPPNARDAKHILEYIFTQLVEFKKLNQDPDAFSRSEIEGEL
ncbi:intraflagellar transport protein 52 homolog [Portunus trituberculatus]|uniref:intraflagellar transport protein 52 homolog n=1 Tax=Portunus trituberculatus TaxID=210409 RepID=UPI001E1CB167|nr:intraflagellar transport protein 52 homolog [Portunus trituberculatus]